MALNWDNIIITTDEYSYSIDAEQRMIIFSGAPGSAGPAGPQGPAATIAVGTTTTLPAGSNATVENVGTDTAAVFNFGIPRGASGGGGASMWGEITGTLSDQTDLQSALNAKANSADLGDLASKDSVNYATEVTNKPTLGSMSAVNDAPSDSKTYGRKNGAWTEVSGGGGGAAWGSITGTLSNQTDLNTALGAKANTADLGTMASEDDAPSNGAEYVRKNGAWSLSNMGLMAEWGHVSGTLADQTDLNTALSAKANTADLGDLATQDTVDYATEVTNKPTLGSLAAKNTADYATDVTNKPTLGSIASANYTVSSSDLGEGQPLATGDLYFYYESGS